MKLRSWEKIKPRGRDKIEVEAEVIEKVFSSNLLAIDRTDIGLQFREELRFKMDLGMGPYVR